MTEGLESVRSRLIGGLLDEKREPFRPSIELKARDPYADPLGELQALLNVLPTTQRFLAGWSVVDGADRVLGVLGPSLGRVTLFPGTEMDWHLWWVDWSSIGVVVSSIRVIPHVLAPEMSSWILDAPPALEWYLFPELHQRHDWRP